jgi:hypothetical protein
LSELYKFRYRTHVHFGQHTRAVHFHSLHPDANIGGNLLVESTTDHVFHHLALAASKLLQTLFDCAADCPFGTLPIIEPKRLIKSREEARAIDRLGQEVYGANSHCVDAFWDITVTREKDDGPRA